MKTLILIFLLSSCSIAAAQSKYCYTPSNTDKKINTCNPQKIQAMISAKGDTNNPNAGVVTLYERIDPNTLQLTAIFPKDMNPEFGTPGQILVNKWSYQVTNETYTDTDNEGCIEKGKFKEDEEFIITIPKSLSKNCDSTRRGFFELLGGEENKFRKILY